MLPDFRIRQRDYMLEIARALTQELDLDKLLGRILDISMELLAGHAGLIALRAETGGWRVHVSRNIQPAFLRFLEPFLTDLPANSEDPEKLEVPEVNRLLKELTYAASMGLLTGVGLPLLARKSVVGVIFIFRNYPDVFSNNDRALLRSFANQAAIAVQNAQLYTQVSREKQRLDALLDSAADGILILDARHQIEHCNPAFARMLEKSVREIRGLDHDQVIQWAKPPNGLTLEQAEAGGWPLTPHAHIYVEGDLKRNSQLPALPIGITYAPLLAKDGVLVNIIATVRDITRFRQADELKSTFVSIISHELKTPVALIKGYVSTLRRQDADWDPAIVQDSLAVIEEESDRLAEMIENMLDATRLQAGVLSIKRSDVSLPDLAKRLATRFQKQSSRHTIVVDFDEPFPIILADETRISQVLSNLISNAMKYASHGEIRIRGTVGSNHVMVCVTDQGPGIASGDIPFVFDRFYRAPDMARATKGAGLGLYLSRAIIESHGGRMWIDPVPEQGARVCFTLPRGGDESGTP
ncbi:MAG: ATP-binding protein [Anaerolineaceae bacterium]|nr:ATP-binding protein [Anaerolineaceae bacterium]